MQLMNVMVSIVNDVFELLPLSLHAVQLFLQLINCLFLGYQVGAHHLSIVIHEGRVVRECAIAERG